MSDKLEVAIPATPTAVVEIEELQGIIVDGQENPLVIAEENKLYEVCKYLSQTTITKSASLRIPPDDFSLSCESTATGHFEFSVLHHKQTRSDFSCTDVGQGDAA
mgnify:CR=1 FL=1